MEHQALARQTGGCPRPKKTPRARANPLPPPFFLWAPPPAVAAGLAPTAPAQAQQPAAAAAAVPAAGSEPTTYLTLTQAEAAFFAAAVDTMIPAHELTPSGRDFGIVTFIEPQLAGAWGWRAEIYRRGPLSKA